MRLMTSRGFHALGLAAVMTTAVAGGARGQAAAPDAPPPAKTSYTGDLGYVSATGNTELSTLNADEKIIRTDGRWIFTELAAYVQGETNHQQSANLTTGALRVDYAWAPRLGGFVGVTYTRNPFAGYNRRFDEIAGARWRVLDDPDDSLSFDGGGVLTQQTDVDSMHETFPAARVAGNYKHAFTKAAYFQQLVEYIPDLKMGGAYRVNTASAVVAPISVHMGIKVSYVVNFNNRPPPTFGTTDRTLTTGVQITW